MNEALYIQDSVQGTCLRGSALFYSAMLVAASFPASALDNNIELANDQAKDPAKIYQLEARGEPTNSGSESLDVHLSQMIDEEISVLLTDFADQQISLDAEAQAILNDNLWDLYITA